MVSIAFAILLKLTRSYRMAELYLTLSILFFPPALRLYVIEAPHLNTVVWFLGSRGGSEPKIPISFSQSLSVVQSQSKVLTFGQS
jgi:hypothetical protein